jgi:hypothetical protein
MGREEKERERKGSIKMLGKEPITQPTKQPHKLSRQVRNTIIEIKRKAKQTLPH